MKTIRTRCARHIYPSVRRVICGGLLATSGCLTARALLAPVPQPAHSATLALWLVTGMVFAMLSAWEQPWRTWSWLALFCFPWVLIGTPFQLGLVAGTLILGGMAAWWWSGPPFELAKLLHLHTHIQQFIRAKWHSVVTAHSSPSDAAAITHNPLALSTTAQPRRAHNFAAEVTHVSSAQPATEVSELEPTISSAGCEHSTHAVPIAPHVPASPPPFNPTGNQSEEPDWHQVCWYRNTRDVVSYEGYFRLEFGIGVKEQIHHVAFCPALPGPPMVDFETAEPGAWEIEATGVYSWGMRVLVRRRSSVHIPQTVVVQFWAGCSLSQPQRTEHAA
ncbi:MAG: hypothetical protein KatS3mg114_0366 [Planctomycetaceae bacterium]|nr:MAG: hypothetical protein KatS3mg114_0366 [Planctomycetaceae bacterium]